MSNRFTAFVCKLFAFEVWGEQSSITIAEQDLATRHRLPIPPPVHEQLVTVCALGRLVTVQFSAGLGTFGLNLHLHLKVQSRLRENRHLHSRCGSGSHPGAPRFKCKKSKSIQASSIAESHPLQYAAWSICKAPNLSLPS